jgi:hypothetical protein
MSGFREKCEKQISFSYFSGNLKMHYKHLGKGKQPPSEMQQKLPNYSSESTLMEVQSAIQGAIAHSPITFIDGKKCDRNPALLHVDKHHNNTKILLVTMTGFLYLKHNY